MASLDPTFSLATPFDPITYGYTPPKAQNNTPISVMQTNPITNNNTTVAAATPETFTYTLNPPLHSSNAYLLFIILGMAALTILM